MSEQPVHYGLMGEFDSAQTLLEGAETVRGQGYRSIEAFSPFPVEGLAAVLGNQRDWIPLWTLLGGIAGAGISYFIQYFSAVHAYPLNIGGRPLHSWPAFIPISIEFTILGAAVCAALALLIVDRLPKLYHPVFNVPRFEHASRDGFFLCLRSDDPKFDQQATAASLRQAGARQIWEVPR